MVLGEVVRRMSTMLSPRQMDALRAAAEGETMREMADRLFLVPATIKWHRHQVTLKLGARSMAHAVHLAHEEGIL
jgi:DNA-binding NarL/FixJ family response regulator